VEPSSPEPSCAEASRNSTPAQGFRGHPHPPARLPSNRSILIGIRIPDFGRIFAEHVNHGEAREPDRADDAARSNEGQDVLGGFKHVVLIAAFLILEIPPHKGGGGWKLPSDRNVSSPSCLKEPLIKSHRGRCGKNWPRARRLGTSIPAAGCKCQANAAPGLLSPQPAGLKAFVDFCRVGRSGETAAGIAQRSRLQKSATVLQRPSWDLISVSLTPPFPRGVPIFAFCQYWLTLVMGSAFSPKKPFPPCRCVA
ncbi:MAG: hypothetical protein RLZZ408_194, partial [Verrucomicrobiota bacterium]